jgi:hypothetical protein
MPKKNTFNFDSPDFYNVDLDEIAILTPYTLLTKNIGSDSNCTCNNITLYKNLCSTGAKDSFLYL